MNQPTGSSKNPWAAFEIRTNQSFRPEPHPPEAQARILCATIITNASESPLNLCASAPNGAIGSSFRTDACREILQILSQLHQRRYALVSWNGLGHDLKALAHNTEEYDACREIALAHCDLMFQFHCYAGFPVSLSAAARAMALPLGDFRRQSIDAASLWEDPGQREEILNQTAQDAATTLAAAQKCHETGRLSWITMRGIRRSLSFPHGLLSVQDAMWLPDPDTSWMDNPIPRSNFYRWLT